MIYVVEDDEGIRELELYALRTGGFEADGFESAEAFYLACEDVLPQLVVLDIMLPGEDGMDILAKLRKRPDTAGIPVMMVTAKTAELDRVKGLDAGADDYIVKPFGVMEFISRVKSLLRRVPQSQGGGDVYTFGDIAIDDGQRAVTVAGASCALTYKEYEMLKLLVKNAGLVLTRDRIMDEVWGYGYEGESRTVDMHVKTLRRKLGEAGAAVQTVRNVGYKIGK